MPVPLVKKFAKRSGKTSKQVDKMWNSVKTSLIDQGHSEDDSNFYPMLVGIMKKNLGLKEEYIFLDKFKSLLGENTIVRNAVGVLIFQEDKILICRATNWGRWDLPKGLVDPEDYNLKSAAVREVKEETGLDVKESDLIALGKYNYKKGKSLFVFAYFPSHKIEVNTLKCVSMVHDKVHGDFPEVDAYKFVEFDAPIPNIDLSLERVLDQVKEKLMKY